MTIKLTISDALVSKTFEVQDGMIIKVKDLDLYELLPASGWLALPIEHIQTINPDWYMQLAATKPAS